MRFLIDHNLIGELELLVGAVSATGWLSLIEIQFVTFFELGLPYDLDDCSLWRFVQEHKMILLTENRNMAGPDSLEETMRREADSFSLPVLTISSRRRLDDVNYRRRCAERLIEIVIDLERYRGVSRIYIP